MIEIPSGLNFYDWQWLTSALKNTVRSSDGCLIWQGYIHPARGYGNSTYRGKHVPTHRQVYQLMHGVKLGRWEFVCHSCDVRLCINPEHLWVGSPDDNNQDMVQKRRTKKYTIVACPKGHPFDQENTYTDKRGWRACRACARIRNNARYARNRDQWLVRQRDRRAKKRSVSIGVTDHRT